MIIFCTALVVICETFLIEAALENHVLLNNRSYSLTGLDQVKQIYMKHITNYSEFNCSFQDNLSVNTESNNTFIMGWALPKKRFSRFNYRQQKYIYDLLLNEKQLLKKLLLKKLHWR